MAIMRTIVTIELLTCWFVRADCSTADEPGQVPHVGGLSNFGKVSRKSNSIELSSASGIKNSSILHSSTLDSPKNLNLSLLIHDIRTIKTPIV